MSKTASPKKKKDKPASPKYSKVYVRCDLAYSTGGGALSDEMYSERETEYRHYEVEDFFLLKRPEGFGIDPVIVPDWKDGTDTIHAVIVHYSTGDTFGRSEGCIDIPIAFVSVEEANKVAKEINCFDKKSKNEQFQDSKYGFFKSWTGYFEYLEGVEVKKLTLRKEELYRSKK